MTTPKTDRGTPSPAKMRKTTEEKVDLKAIVAACLEESSYNSQNAIDMLMERGFEDPAIYKAICDQGYPKLCENLIGAAVRRHSAQLREEADRLAAERRAAAAPEPQGKIKPRFEVTPAMRDAVRGIATYQSPAATMPIQGLGRICDLTFGQIRGVLPQIKAASRTMVHRTAYLERIVAIPGSLDHMRTTAVIKTDAQFTALYEEARDVEAA